MSKPLVRLRLLGGVTIERNGVPLASGRATQRRRLAVLVLLAAAPGRRMSRDKLVGYLWPESGSDAARHLLSGSIYELRKELGEKAILSQGDDVALNGEEVATDVADFERLVEQNEKSEALALYRGPFADGFYVSDAPEFERWVEETRARWQRTCRELLEAEGRWEEVVRLDPADPRATLRAMVSLHGAGKSAAAIRLGQDHAERVRREWGGEPHPEVQALVEKIRLAPARVTPVAELPSVVVPPGRTSQPSSAGAATRPLAVRSMIAGFAGGALVLVLVVLAGLRARHDPDPVTLPGTVLVLPFATPDGRHDVLRRRIATLMQAGLDGAGDIEVSALPANVLLPAGAEAGRDSAATLAAGAGAAGFTLGQVEELSESLRLRAWLYARGRAEPLVEAAITGSPARLAETVDHLVLRLLAAWPRPPAERMAGVAARSARSLPALKAWLGGEQEYHAGRFLAAAERFAEAVAADSTFALAYHRLSQARLAADFPETRVIVLDNRASELSTALAERDQLLIRAYIHFRNGEAAAAEQRYQSLVNLYPDDVEAWTGLGESRFHYNPLRGLPVLDAAPAFARAAEVSPGNWTVQWHLAQLAGLEGRLGDVVRILDRLLAQDPEAATRQDLSYLRALALRDRAAEDRLRGEIANADELRLFQLIWRAAVFLKDLDGAERVARVLADPSRPPYPRMVGMLSLVYLDLARGDWSGAQENLERAQAIPGVAAHVFDTRVVMSLLPQSPVTEEARRQLRDSILASFAGEDSLPPRELRHLGMLSSALGDTARAHRFARALEGIGEAISAITIQADVAYRAGRYQQALDLLHRQPGPAWYGYQIGAPLSYRPYLRYLEGESLRMLGRHGEARGWYQSLLEFALADLVYAPVVKERMTSLNPDGSQPHWRQRDGRHHEPDVRDEAGQIPRSLGMTG